MTDTQRVRLSGLTADAFVCPADRAALRNLQKLPLLPKLVHKFNEYAIDRLWYVQNASTAVRCSRKQFPTLYGLMREACDILDLSEPELYLAYSPVHNAYTAGVQRPFIVLNSSLVEDFTDDELLFILGHELGHIKCGHVLYGMLGRFLLPLLDAIGQATLGMGQLVGRGLLAGFFEWMRQAEFSCDRAGLLACQDHRTALSATMRLGCGSTRFNGEMSVEAFLEQARSHAEPKAEGITKALMFLMYSWQLEHPQVVFRAKTLDEWYTDGDYHRIVSGSYVRKALSGEALKELPQGFSGSILRCSGCKAYLTVLPGDTVCNECGTAIPDCLETVSCKTCERPLHSAARFCAECGTPVKRGAAAAA